jgi:hypothetical protein
MGLLLFFILHRIAVFFYLLFATYADVGFEYYRFVFWDYATLSVVLVIGGCYGLWLGKYWYKSVYHEAAHGGLVSYLNAWIWDDKPVKVEVYKHKLQEATQKIEADLLKLENLENNFPVALKPKRVIKRSTVSAKKPAAKRTTKTKKTSKPKA